MYLVPQGTFQLSCGVFCMEILYQFLWQCQILTWWRHKIETFSRYWPFVWGIHQSPVNFPHKGQWRRALVFSLFCVWINGWVNNREASYLRRYRAHYDVTSENISCVIISAWHIPPLQNFRRVNACTTFCLVIRHYRGTQQTQGVKSKLETSGEELNKWGACRRKGVHSEME